VLPGVDKNPAQTRVLVSETLSSGDGRPQPDAALAGHRRFAQSDTGSGTRPEDGSPGPCRCADCHTDGDDSGGAHNAKPR
jgi:hypothetical protein